MGNQKEKLGPKQKRCFDCKKVKHKFKDFKSRWGRCEKHKEQGKPFQAKCKACNEAVMSNIRQPRCIECDAKRPKKQPVAATAKAGKAKKGKKPSTIAAPVTTAATAPTEVQAPAPAAPAPVATAPVEPTPVSVPPAPKDVAPPPTPPATVPTPTGTEALKAVAGLLGDEEGDKRPFDVGASATVNAGAPKAEEATITTGKGAVETPLPPRPLFRGPPAQGPKVAVRGAKGCSQGRHYAQANLTEIKRILAALTTREERVARAETKLAEANARLRESIAVLRDKPSAQAEARYTNAKEAREIEILRVKNCRDWREFTAQRLRLYLDHALNTTPYSKKDCTACENGKVEGAPCSKCNGTGKLQIENPNPFARTAVPILKHISRVLEEAELCFKVRARTSDSEQAFQKLLEANQGVVKKFGNPKQTALEGDDATQGAIIGLYDGAKRYAPTQPTHYLCPKCGYKEAFEGDVGFDPRDHLRVRSKPCPRVKRGEKCNAQMMIGTSTASFQTYTWKWSQRNSRARKDTEKRPGLLHASIDDPGLGGKSSDDGGVADQVTVVDGKASIVSERMGAGEIAGLTNLDLREEIEKLEDPQQREVVVSLLASMQPGEIAAKLGITTRQVAKIKDAAFAAMRKRLAAYLED